MSTEQILVRIKMDGFAPIINKIDYNKFKKGKVNIFF